MTVALVFLIVLFLIAAAAIITAGKLANRLLRFDGLWDELDEALWSYQSYLEDKTGQTIRIDHPEVREFHQKNVELRDRMRELAKAVGQARGKAGKWASISDGTSTSR